MDKIRKAKEFNPFKGRHEAQYGRMSALSGTPNYRSGNLSPQDRSLSPNRPKQEQSQTQPAGGNPGSKSTDQEWLANLIFKINYQLEKLRFILEGKVYPRDEQLKLFDTGDDFDEETKDGITIKKLDHDCNLLLAQKITSELYSRIHKKMTHNSQTTLKS